MKHKLSILIPTYNDYCYNQVERLWQQAIAIKELQFEIIVADDGSTIEDVVTQNSKIAQLPNCRFVRSEVNRGRAATRNSLADMVSFENMLFIDTGVMPSSDQFINTYLYSTDGYDVVCGGIELDGSQYAGNLRFRYEDAVLKRMTIEKRNKSPYKSFRSTNFLITKTAFKSVCFNEQFATYGYEDVLFGKNLKEAGFNVVHIDNPVVYKKFEDNELFLKKTDESLITLRDHSDELRGYSRIIELSDKLHRFHLLWAVRLLHRIFRNPIRRSLCADNPSPTLFNIYKLGEYSRLL